MLGRNRRHLLCLINDHLGNWVSLMKWVHASICEVYGREGLVEGDFGRLLLEGGSS